MPPAKRVPAALVPSLAIQLHSNCGLQNAKNGKLKALGYDFIPGKGYAGTPVHVKPGRKRISRFRRRLAQKLCSAGPGSAPFQVGRHYAAAWFAGNRAWTKVPVHSRRACLESAFSYVDDWLSHVPMGGLTSKDFDPSKPLGGYLEAVAALPLRPEWVKNWDYVLTL